MKKGRVTRKTRSRARKYRARTRRGGAWGLSKLGCVGAACSAGVAISPQNAKLKMATDKVSETSKVLETLEAKKERGEKVSNQELKAARAAYTAATDEMNKEIAAVSQQYQTATNDIAKNAQKNLAKIGKIDEIMSRNIGRKTRTPAQNAKLKADYAEMSRNFGRTPEENAKLNADYAEINALGEEDPNHP
jgi:hypothetical protein